MWQKGIIFTLWEEKGITTYPLALEQDFLINKGRTEFGELASNFQPQ